MSVGLRGFLHSMVLGGFMSCMVLDGSCVVWCSSVYQLHGPQGY